MGLTVCQSFIVEFVKFQYLPVYEIGKEHTRYDREGNNRHARKYDALFEPSQLTILLHVETHLRCIIRVLRLGEKIFPRHLLISRDRRVMMMVVMMMVVVFRVILLLVFHILRG